MVAIIGIITTNINAKFLFTVSIFLNLIMKFGIYVRCNNANNCYHTLSLIALFLPIKTFSVNIHLHSQLFHQEIVF